MNSRVLVILVLMALVLTTVAVGTASAAYGVGFVWNRTADYQTGTVVDTPAGNPNTDSQGNAVWAMDTLAITGGLSDPTPWFQGAGTPMNWVQGYQGGNYWASGVDGGSAYSRSPFIGNTTMYWQTYHSSMFGLSSAANAPASTWISPVNGKVSVTGTMQFQSYNYVNGSYNEWSPEWAQLSPPRTVNGVGGPAVVAKKSAADGTWTVLASANIALTGDYQSFTAEWTLTGMDSVDVSVGDEIRYTFMPSDWADFDHGNWAGDNWMWSNAKGGAPMNITLQQLAVPEPSSLIAMACGLISFGGLLRRRA